MAESVALTTKSQTTIELPGPDGTEAGGAERVVSAAATVEHLLYALVFLLGLGARILMLGTLPFASHEAAAAWAAWMDATAQHPTVAPETSSALLHALQTLIFWITGGANETLARLPVALVSSLIPLLPWFWRDRLGRPAALVLAALLALDPWLLAFGRMADSTALSAALALLALTAIHIATRAMTADAVENSGGLAPYVAAVSAGLLLVSGPQAWSWLPILALYLWLVAEERRNLLNLRVGLVALVAALFGATGWLAWPQELAMIGASLSEWMRLFTSGAYNVLWPATRMLVDQPFLMLFGLLGVVLVWVRPTTDRGARLFLTIWLLWALLLLMAPGRVPASLPLFGIPLAAFAALSVQWLYRLARTTAEWSEAALLGLVLLAALIANLFWATQLIWQATPKFTGSLALLLMFGIVALLLAVFAQIVNARQALIVGAGIVAIFLLAASLSAARQLAYTSDPGHPNGLFATTTWADAATLRTDVRGLSDRRTGYPTELPVQVVTGATRTPDPLIGWLLRDMANLTFVTAPVLDLNGDPNRAPLLVVPPASDQSAWSDTYIGSTVRLRSAWLPADLPPLTGYDDGAQRWNAGWRPRLRWLIYRAAPTQAVPETVTLWATPQ